VEINLRKIVDKHDSTFKLLLELKGIYSKHNKSEISRIFQALSMIFEDIFITEFDILISRLKTGQIVKSELAENAKRKQQRAMDRILHPEKYRSKSPTVRTVGSNSGTGRYSPSAAAQSRRQVKKGG
jgi:hypothetical protein